MRPAFPNRKKMIVFAALVAGTMAMPALIGATGWLKREDVYSSIQWRHGPYPWVQQQVFERTSDIDILFLGASHLWNAIATPEVQAALSRKLGREAEVITLGRPWHGYDANYVIASDLLAHRKVKMIVTYDEGDLPHQLSSRWIRFGENFGCVSGLPWTEVTATYANCVVGMPRHLLSLVRENRWEDPANCRPNFWNDYYGAPHPARERGALRASLSYSPNGPEKKFVPFTPSPGASPDAVVRYGPETKSRFAFTGAPVSGYSQHFGRLLAKLCADRGIKLVVLHLPELERRRDRMITERQDWTSFFGAPVELQGVAEGILFEGLTDVEVERCFFDGAHLNRNGQDYFTRVIAPRLIDAYSALHEKN